MCSTTFLTIPPSSGPNLRKHLSQGASTAGAFGQTGGTHLIPAGTAGHRDGPLGSAHPSSPRVCKEHAEGGGFGLGVRELYSATAGVQGPELWLGRPPAETLAKSFNVSGPQAFFLSVAEKRCPVFHQRPLPLLSLFSTFFWPV